MHWVNTKVGVTQVTQEISLSESLYYSRSPPQFFKMAAVDKGAKNVPAFSIYIQSKPIRCTQHIKHGLVSNPVKNVLRTLSMNIN